MISAWWYMFLHSLILIMSLYLKWVSVYSIVWQSLSYFYGFILFTFNIIINMAVLKSTMLWDVFFWSRLFVLFPYFLPTFRLNEYFLWIYFYLHYYHYYYFGYIIGSSLQHVGSSLRHMGSFVAARGLFIAAYGLLSSCGVRVFSF